MESVLGLVRHAGNDGLFRAIEMSLLSTLSGQPLHLHAEGLRGTGKTTIMRAVRKVLPPIRRISGCLYNCDPARPHCPKHAELSPEAVAALGDEWVPMPFLEISHSAKVGSAIGSIDLGRLVSPSEPQAALLPGTIPQAHRGIIFVDEINRLAETAPELADVLLDVMGTKPGRVQIEETGLPKVELTVEVSVWAASNPDEDPGPLEDIRRQLSDRFDFAVYTDRPGEAAVVERILTCTADRMWGGQPAADPGKVSEFREHIGRLVAAHGTTVVEGDLRRQVAEIYSRFNLESLRAVQAIQAGMRLSACIDGRPAAGTEDLARMATLALRHRVDQETMKKIMAHLSGLNPRQEALGPGQMTANVRPRFPNISFGAALVNPESEAAAQSENEGDPGGASRLSPPKQEWPTQYPPGADAPATGESWLTRALAGLRRNLGLAEMEPESPRPGRSGLRAPYRESLTTPRAGRFFQEAGHGGVNPRTVTYGPDGMPRTPGQIGAGQQESGGDDRNPLQSVDPLKMPPAAPPHAARPVSQLSPEDLIRTEEELDSR